MNDTIIEPGVVHTLGHISDIENSLPLDSQLRFISGTSLNQTFGATCIVYDRETDAILLVPYFLKRSHEQQDQVEVPENPESLALRLIAKEAVLQSSTVKVLGPPFMVKNKKHQGERFPKYVVLITDFKPEERISIETNSNKNGKPLWVHRELLKYIFEKTVVINDIPRDHPQLEAYKRFKEYYPMYSELERW